MKKNIQKIFIANRGEIARRIAVTCKEMQIKTLTLVPEGEEVPRYYRGLLDDIVISSEPSPYLNVDHLIALAKGGGCDALHPGYGFLSENLHFAEQVIAAGLIFIGPKPSTIKAMASKASASDIAEKAGVPCMPSLRGIDLKKDSAKKNLEQFSRDNLPLLVKAALGGGGKGMRIVRDTSEIQEACERAASEALNAFNDSTLIVERYLEKARHLEVQVLGDSKGNVVVVGDRDCSIQRRYQKIIEEAPAPNLSDETRTRLHKAALALAESVNYESAGTVEFLLDASEPSRSDPDFFFLEMNTRLQVEHPVTEEVFGIDLVEWQIRVANGETLPKAFRSLQPRGHSFEMRVYAEDPENGFMPSPGYVACFEPFYAQGVRWEIGIDALSDINPQYDPMIAKLVVTGETRERALQKADLVLDQTFFCGPKNNLDFMRRVMSEDFFKKVHHNTNSLSTYIYANNVDSDQQFDQLINSLLAQKSSSTIVSNRRDTTPAQKLVVRSFSKKTAPLLELQVAPHSRAFYEDSQRNVKIEVGSATSSCVGANLFRFCICYKAQETILFVKYRSTVRQVTKLIENDEINSDNDVVSNEALAPVPGKVVKVLVQEAQEVEAGTLVAILESMKMEFMVKSPKAGIVKKLLVKEGQQVASSQKLLDLEG